MSQVRSPPSARATAAGRSPASSSCRTAVTRAGPGSARPRTGPPSYAIGVGSPVAGKDREILGVTVAETILDDSRVDLAVSAVSHGLGSAPIELRLLENGRPIDVKRVTPAADGSPVREVFQVSPGKGAPTVYTVETPLTAGELVPENNARSVLVQPPARARRVLLVEGAPGFEHSFLKRAWASDPGLEIDSVVRKGKNEHGADTFYVQAAQSRSDSLATGYPSTRDALFRYDALVLANVEAHQFTRAELEATRRFVGDRGGGLLVLGARSFLRQGLAGSLLEDVLPLELNAGGGTAVDRDDRAERGPPVANARGVNRVSLTPAGEAHPIMQLAARRRRYAEAMGGRAGACGDHSARRAATRCERAGGHERSRRHAARARGRATLRRRPVDGLCRRGLVALAHAAARDRSLVRHVLEAIAALAGARRRRPDSVDGRARGGVPAIRCRCASSRATPRSSRCRTPASTSASPRRTAASSRCARRRTRRGSARVTTWRTSARNTPACSSCRRRCARGRRSRVRRRPRSSSAVPTSR